MDEPAKNRVWELLGAGLDCPAVARSLGMGVTSVRAIEANAGGVRPRPRLRAERVLSLEEREEISRGLAEDVSLREIARRLGRAPSTVSREVAHNGGRANYRALGADRRAWERAQRPKPAKLMACPRLRREVDRARSPTGWLGHTPWIPSCAFRTRRSTSPSTCRVEGLSEPSSARPSAAAGRSASPRPAVRSSAGAGSPTWC